MCIRDSLVVELASRLVSKPRYTTSEKTEWVLHLSLIHIYGGPALRAF